eukprot:scaffold127213_cov36-Tisochrysis_lutea.AAC.2
MHSFRPTTYSGRIRCLASHLAHYLLVDLLSVTSLTPTLRRAAFGRTPKEVNGHLLIFRTGTPQAAPLHACKPIALGLVLMTIHRKITCQTGEYPVSSTIIRWDHLPHEHAGFGVPEHHSRPLMPSLCDRYTCVGKPLSITTT